MLITSINGNNSTITYYERVLTDMARRFKNTAGHVMMCCWHSQISSSLSPHYVRAYSWSVATTH